MAKKNRSNTRSWTPDSPLHVDWATVLDKKGQPVGSLERAGHADNPLHPKGGGPNHPMSQASHRSHIRQKKG